MPSSCYMHVHKKGTGRPVQSFATAVAQQLPVQNTMMLAISRLVTRALSRDHEALLSVQQRRAAGQALQFPHSDLQLGELC